MVLIRSTKSLARLNNDRAFNPPKLYKNQPKKVVDNYSVRAYTVSINS